MGQFVQKFRKFVWGFQEKDGQEPLASGRQETAPQEKKKSEEDTSGEEDLVADSFRN